MRRAAPLPAELAACEVLLIGTIPVPGRRTVASIVRAIELARARAVHQRSSRAEPCGLERAEGQGAELFLAFPARGTIDFALQAICTCGAKHRTGIVGDR
jgi:hypothetical protein